MRHLKTGLTLHDQDRATPGYTLFSPFGFNTTLLIDLGGEVVHRWELPGYVGPYGYLLANGNLLVAIQTPEGPGLPGGGGSTPSMVPWSKCQAMADLQTPKSGSSPTQHGQSILQVQTSNRLPWRRYAMMFSS